MATKKKAAKKPARKPASPARKAAKRPAAKKAAARIKAKPARRQPENLRLRMTTPSLTVKDLMKSVAFYRDVLGFLVEEEYEWEGKVSGVNLKAGAMTFLLSQDDFAKGHDRKKGEGFRLYCITAQDIDKLAAQVEVNGGTLATPPTDQPWGMRDFSIVDPDGFKVSISSPK
jgi:uncharacterized glyoxalase superfamily protein PhnB